MKPRVCKLVSGELVVADIEEQDGGVYKFTNTMHIMFVPGPTEQQLGLQLIPYIPILKKGNVLEIHKDRILCWVEDYPPEINAQFLSATTGIVVASAQPPKELAPGLKKR